MTACKRYVVAVSNGCAVDIVLPVVRRSRTISFQVRIKLCIVSRLEFIAVLHDFFLQFYEFVSVHYGRSILNLTYSHATVISDCRFSSQTFLGSYDNNTVGTTSTVDSCSRSIFQYVDRLDIVRIERAQTR